jgi:hypothetical protein
LDWAFYLPARAEQGDYSSQNADKTVPARISHR